MIGLDAGEEVAAQTFLIAFQRRGSFDPSYASARPWLFGIAQNSIRHHLRGEARRKKMLGRLPADPGPADVLTPEALEAAGASPALSSALRQLSPDQRETFLLVALGELSYEETAQILDVPVGTIRSRVHRIRAVLRELLVSVVETPDGDDDDPDDTVIGGPA